MYFYNQKNNYYELDARTLHKALKEKRNEKPIVEIFASRPSWFLQIVNDEYKKLYGITLKEELSQEKKEMVLIHFEEYNGSRKLISLELLD